MHVFLHFVYTQQESLTTSVHNLNKMKKIQTHMCDINSHTLREESFFFSIASSGIVPIIFLKKHNKALC